jgi:hypothetical protein
LIDVDDSKHCNVFLTKAYARSNLQKAVKAEATCTGHNLPVTFSTASMAAANINTDSKKPGVVLTVNDILSDLEKLPQVQSSPSTSSQPYTRQPLPDASENVDTSIELSQRFIESSKRVLQDTDALDEVRAGLDRVDRSLGEIEQGVRA